MNKLKNEKSPYLQQHSSNPVDWYPWGDEAFDKAKKENKPIFVSIGYATCHWCHVMAHESFEDGEVADILNQNFISIKVDREERPDIDTIYMTVCQMMTGQGGWPLSIFISPNKDPFFAGTYFPKESKGQRLGFKDLLQRVSDIWVNKRSEVQTTLDNVRDALIQAKGSQPQGPQVLAQEFTQKITAELKDSFDPKNGGFGTAPKFPSSHKLQFLLDQFAFQKKSNSQDDEILSVVEKTLSEMHRGGFYDHIGGGVHRYSTDEAWELPHFEKMLYDQANCALTYTIAYQVTQNIFYKKIAEDILNFCIRDLRLPKGGYASAFDADSEGEEGKFYVWAWSELEQNLSAGEFEFLKRYYNLSEDGNFHDEATGEKVDKNIFLLKKSFYEISPDKAEKYFQEFEPIKQKLFNLRSKRIKPLLDDKVLCDWNSFLAVALFRAGHVFGNTRFVKEAVNILDFLDRNLLDFGTDGDEIYFHRYCDEDTLKISFLDDQSYMMWALTEAYAATLETSYLHKLESLFKGTQSKFGDPQSPGMYLTPEKQEVIVTRTKEVYDGAHPSGAAVYYYACVVLARLTRNDKLLKEIEAQLEKLSTEFVYAPSSHSFWGRSSLLLENSYEELYVRGASLAEKKALEGILKRTYRPGLIYHGDNKVLLAPSPMGAENQAESIQEFPESEKLRIYLCQDYVCLQPLTTVAELEKHWVR